MPFRLSIPMQSAAVARLLRAVSNQISLTMNDPGMRERDKRIGGRAHVFSMFRLWKLMGRLTPSKATIAV